MSVFGLIAELERLGIRLSSEGDRLRVGGSQEMLTPALLDSIRSNKAGILEWLDGRNGQSRDAAARYEPFPLSDIQQAYFVGRSGGRDLGGVSCHTYHEFNASHLDLDRLEAAWRKLIERHDMLRAIVLPDARQQVLRDVPPYRIERLDLRGLPREEADAAFSALRERVSHEVRPAGEWPLFDIRATLLDDRTVLHFGFDLLIGDAATMLLLFQEWSLFYRDADAVLPPVDYSFREYVLAEQSLETSAPFERARKYWTERLDSLQPGPDIPLRAAGRDGIPRFHRRSGKLDCDTWSRLKSRASEAAVTPSAVLCSAYAEALGTWSARRDFTLNLTLFRRQPLHPRVNHISGDFTSTIPLAVDRGAVTFRGRAQALQAQLGADLDHLEYSGVRVARDLARRGEEPGHSLGAYVFTSILGQSAQAGSALAWLGEILFSVSQTPQVLLDHQVREDNGALVFTWDTPDDRYPPGLVDDMFESYCRLLTRLAEDRGAWDSADLELLPPRQAARRIAVNATEAEISNERLESLFLKQAAADSGRAAVISGDRVVTYAELDRLSNSLAHRLHQEGARPGGLVAVVMEKGWEQAAAVLGVLRSGAAYVPIDPGVPEERLRTLLTASEAAIVLTQPALKGSLPWPAGIRVLTVDNASASQLARFETTGSPDDLAYVIYTSGSTGVPKGVMIDHRGAVNTILDVNRRFAIGPDDRVLGISALTFDLSVWDIFGILAAGGALVLPDERQSRDPAQWFELIQRHRVTVWNSVPLLMSLLADHVHGASARLPASLRLVMMSGDWIPVGLPARIRAIADDPQLISMGGATEASIWSILYPIGDVAPEWKSIPYGRPMANQQFHVLNARLEPCPDWVPGDLYIGGIGLARGYWNDEAKTRAGFITHPLTGARLYRTGDLGRYLPDGNIEFLGRADSQVKVNGYRIELGEIESALLRHPAVVAAVASAAGERGGARRLMAHVVVDGHDPSDEELTRFLARSLPDYMIPGAFVRIPSLPLSANGKVDRKALPMPADVRRARAKAQPDSAVGGRVLDLVTEVLGQRIEAEASLLHSGANSVDLIRLATLLETEFGSRPEMTEFFQMQTPARITEFYERALGPRVQAPAPAETVWERHALLLKPEQREAFKRAGHGLRKPQPEWEPVGLPRVSEDAALMAQFTERRSHRRFGSEEIPLEALSRLLSVLRCGENNGRTTRYYGSAGASYSLQTYLYAAGGRIHGLRQGAYYYGPAAHRLFRISDGAGISEDLHILDNRGMFSSSAFSIFLICDAGAIAPLYGPKGRDLALIEAGLQTQLLEMAAPAAGLGLCQIGSLDFEPARGAFALGPEHVLMHSLVGGGAGWEEGSL